MAKEITKRDNEENKRNEKGNLTSEYIDKIVKESIKQNPIVYERLAKI